MKYVINYHSVQSEHIFATPQHTHSEFVEVDTVERLNEYISTKRDLWGHSYRVNEEFGNPNSVSKQYNYISNQGGVIVEEYTQPDFRYY